MIEAKNVSKWFSNVQALDNVSFEVPKNRTIALLGPNGAGKTTLIRVLAGRLYPSSGRVEVRGQNIESNDYDHRKQTGYVPESTPVYPEMTPLSYLRYRSRLKRVNPETTGRSAEDVVEICSLQEYVDHPCGMLSRGYRKRLGIAEALLGNPDLLLLDEPTEGLDPAQLETTREILASLQSETTLVLSSHVLQEVDRLSDRFLILKNGGKVFHGTRQDLLANQNGNCYIVEIETSSEDVISSIDELDSVDKVRVEGNTRKENDPFKRIEICSHSDPREEVFELCRRMNWKLRELQRKRLDLEDSYLDLIRSNPKGE